MTCKQKIPTSRHKSTFEFGLPAPFSLAPSIRLPARRVRHPCTDTDAGSLYAGRQVAVSRATAAVVQQLTVCLAVDGQFDADDRRFTVGW
jgi:hypothetical protein